MFDETIFLARPSSIDEPVWEPLKAFLPIELVGSFMWMNASYVDGLGPIQSYKHDMSRRYLHLDTDALPYEYLSPGRFRRTRRTDAIEQSIDMPFVLFHATREEETLLKQAFERAVELDQGASTPTPRSRPAHRPQPSAGFPT